jgi:hypothetical protein
MPASHIVNDVDSDPPYAPEKDLIAGICALLLVGYLFWGCYRKFQKDSQNEQAAKENTLYNISLETGRNEYDLFIKSAENWSVSGQKVEQDFKRYMADQLTPHYARDFVRKNQEHIDESLLNKKEVTPTSWSDWVIALLVFPGSVLLMFLMSIFFVNVFDVDFFGLNNSHAQQIRLDKVRFSNQQRIAVWMDDMGNQKFRHLLFFQAALKNQAFQVLAFPPV